MSLYIPPPKLAYKNIYVHSKLLLVDDVFFTIGSANVNIRSMEIDSELNIAMTSPAVTRQWRKDLWRIHTGLEPDGDIQKEFKRWEKILRDNAEKRRGGKPLSVPLIEFYDDASSGSRKD